MREILLTQGKVAMVDDEDFCWLNCYTWCAERKGKTFYAQTHISGRAVNMHRLILGLTDPRKQADHKNHNGLDNQRKNLHAVDASFNQLQNGKQNKIFKRMTSKYKGVSWCKRTKSWKAQITIKSKTLWCGRFKKEDDAAKAYDNKALAVLGKKAQIGFVLNFR